MTYIPGYGNISNAETGIPIPGTNLTGLRIRTT
jgi:hypothetical protein